MGGLPSQARQWVRTLEERLLPTFDNLKSETDKMVAEMRAAYPDLERIDPFSAENAMFEAAMSHYDMNLSVKQGLVNIFAAGLYHLFEQQVQEFHFKALYGERFRYAVDTLKKWNEILGTPLPEKVKAELDELRELANTVKHGDGSAAQKLYKLNPTLFQNEWERDEPEDFGVIVHKPEVFAPMYGQDIYLQIEDVRRFQALVTQLWEHYFNLFIQPSTIR